MKKCQQLLLPCSAEQCERKYILSAPITNQELIYEMLMNALYQYVYYMIHNKLGCIFEIYIFFSNLIRKSRNIYEELFFSLGIIFNIPS